MRPVTLFTGQWADLPLEAARRRGRRAGASTGSSSPAGATTSRSSGRSPSRATRAAARALLERHGLGCWAHRRPPRRPGGVRSDRRAPPGDPAAGGLGRRRAGGRAGARRRADEGHGAGRRPRSGSRRSTASPARRSGTCSTPSRPTTSTRDRARLRAVRRALGADPRRLRGRGRALRARGAPDRDRLRLRHDRRTLAALGRRPGFGINLDPSHFAHQFLDPGEFALEFADRIYHVTSRTAKRRLDGRRSILGSHLDFGEAERGWDFVSPGHGDVDFEELLRALNRIGYDGPLSIEWEDAGMDREWGARDALAFVRRSDFPPSRSPSTRDASS